MLRDAIPTGREHALTKQTIASCLGWPVREVEEAIQLARLNGAPILSNGDGYWLSNDPAEIRACSERLRSRALTQLETAGALKKAADVLPMTLFGDAS